MTSNATIVTDVARTLVAVLVVVVTILCLIFYGKCVSEHDEERVPPVTVKEKKTKPGTCPHWRSRCEIPGCTVHGTPPKLQPAPREDLYEEGYPFR